MIELLLFLEIIQCKLSTTIILIEWLMIELYIVHWPGTPSWLPLNYILVLVLVLVLVLPILIYTTPILFHLITMIELWPLFSNNRHRITCVPENGIYNILFSAQPHSTSAPCATSWLAFRPWTWAWRTHCSTSALSRTAGWSCSAASSWSCACVSTRRPSSSPSWP